MKPQVGDILIDTRNPQRRYLITHTEQIPTSPSYHFMWGLRIRKDGSMSRYLAE